MFSPRCLGQATQTLCVSNVKPVRTPGSTTAHLRGPYGNPLHWDSFTQLYKRSGMVRGCPSLGQYSTVIPSQVRLQYGETTALLVVHSGSEWYCRLSFAVCNLYTRRGEGDWQISLLVLGGITGLAAPPIPLQDMQEGQTRSTRVLGCSRFVAGLEQSWRAGL